MPRGQEIGAKVQNRYGFRALRLPQINMEVEKGPEKRLLSSIYRVLDELPCYFGGGYSLVVHASGLLGTMRCLPWTEIRQ